MILTAVDSTHALGRRLAKEYSNESRSVPRVDLIAWQQTAGRGRHQRTWNSPRGAGIYLSCLRPLAASANLEWMSLRIGIESCREINRGTDSDLHHPCRLKWPNDLLMDGRKVGGILVDVLSRGQDTRSALVSIGVNVGRATDELPSTAASLELVDQGFDVAANLTAGLIRGIDRALESTASNAISHREFERLSHHEIGESIRVRVGDAVTEGEFRGLNSNGNLLLQVGETLHEVNSGVVLSGE